MAGELDALMGMMDSAQRRGLRDWLAPFISPTAAMILAHQNKTGYSFALQLKCLPCCPPVTAAELSCYECVSPESTESYNSHALSDMPSWLGGMHSSE